ncbi:autotransporter outer membrane beta-barrel domain-containing protein [Hydrogenophaga sp. 5NK40-0174]|uniref:autotransporter family protein n=1 Tax=Hydrogenophaga sp. 5NK40-0174 TaxID=3127649 RepID=UPI00310343C5
MDATESLTVESTGVISFPTVPVSVTGIGDGVIVNEGRIEAGVNVAVRLYEGTSFGSVVNHGQITSRLYGVRVDSGAALGRLDNHGLIEVTPPFPLIGNALHVFGRLETLNNHAGGVLRSSDDWAAISLGADGQLTELNNAGLIDGIIATRDTTINLVGSSGRITGAVFNPVSGVAGTGDGSVNVLSGADFSTENTFNSGSFNVRSGGTLRIKGTSHTIRTTQGFSNEGTVYVPEGVAAQVGGAYRQTGRLTVGASSSASYGRLSVAGSVTLEPGASFGVDVAAANTLANGDVLDRVLLAEGGFVNQSGGTPEVIDNSALFDFRYDEAQDGVNLVVELVSSSPSDEVTSSSGSSGSSGSSSGDSRGTATATASVPQSILVPATIANGLISGVPAARVMDTYVVGGARGDDWDKVVTALGKLPTQRALAAAVGQSMPLMHGDMGAALMGSGAAAGASSVGAPVSYGGSFSYQGREYNTGGRQLWVQPMNIAGYKSTTTGVAAGVSHALSTNQTIGVGIGYLDTNIHGNGFASGQHADVTGVQLRGFGEHAVGSDGYQLNWQADLTRSSIESQRNITYIGRKAEGETDADVWHLGVSVSRAMELSQQTQVEPMVNLDWRQARIDAYTETGAGALNLRVAKQRAEELVLSVGTRLKHAYSEKLSVSGYASVGYDLKGDAGSTTAQFTGGGAVFTTESQETARERLQLGATLNWQATKAMDLSVGYGIQRRSGMTDQALTARLNWVF